MSAVQVYCRRVVHMLPSLALAPFSGNCAEEGRKAHGDLILPPGQLQSNCFASSSNYYYMCLPRSPGVCVRDGAVVALVAARGRATVCCVCLGAPVSKRVSARWRLSRCEPLGAPAAARMSARPRACRATGGVCRPWQPASGMQGRAEVFACGARAQADRPVQRLSAQQTVIFVSCQLLERI